MHYIYMEELYMIKGHVAIELHNHKTGLRDRIEGDNMITNALGYAIPNVIGANYSADNIMPIYQKALGSLMLFDGLLTEDKSNIFFPSEAHLVASANRNLNTTDSDRGSLNAAESYKTDTGYQSVWDFSTSQANGTIKSLALTLNAYNKDQYSAIAYNFVSPFIRYGIKNDKGETSFSPYPLCYDADNQMLYYISTSKGGTQSYQEEDESGKKVTKYKTECHVIKTYVPTSQFKLADKSNNAELGEEVATFCLETGTSYIDVRGAIRNGYDGYAYMCTPRGTEGKVELYKLKVSDYSFELSELISFDCKSTKMYNQWGYSTVSKGYAYIISLEKKSIYIVNLANPVDVSECVLPNDLTIYDKLTALKNGGVAFSTQKRISGTSSYEYRGAICYPDGKIIVSKYYATNTSTSYPILYPPRLFTDNLMTFGFDAYSSSYLSRGALVNNYLGTIYNLPQPIVKTAASSMKVVYTLTDID